jgi:mycothiol synthase
MHIRPFRHPDDLNDLRRLFEQCRSADGHAPIGEHKYLDLIGGNPETSGFIFEVANHLIAYVHLSSPAVDADWVLEAAIHPDYRDPAVIKGVLRSAVDLATGGGGGTIRMWTYLPAITLLVEELGFRQERQLLQLRLALPPRKTPAPPKGMQVTSFRVGTDEAAWIALNNRAFAGHPENGSWTRAILADRMRQDWFDPDGVLMARQGSELVGFCWTKLHRESIGEIYVIAVDPDHQGRSLGTWLTLEGLWYLSRRRQATTAMLYVDAANRSAVAMYERLGFGLDHVDRSFTRDAGGGQPEMGEPNTRAHDGQA